MGDRAGIFPDAPVSVNKKKTRRSKRKSYKKYCNFYSNDNKWSIFHTNIRGYNSKKKSFVSIINGINPSIITINELGYKKDKKLTIPGYHCYNRNRTSENMGGVATAIKESEKMFAIKTAEGLEKDEFILTRHSQFRPPINILNCYGEIESRSSRKEIEERWYRLLELIAKVEVANESLILIGDLNKLVGNGEYGVKGNCEKVSFGGKLVHSLLSSGKYILANNSEKCTGGPFTRMDPADHTRLSCLDLVIISTCLYPYLVSLNIDKERIMTPHRPAGRKKLIYTDHFPILVTFKNIPVCMSKDKQTEKHSVWNTNKTGGWEMYKNLTEDNDDLESLAKGNISDTTEYNQKLETLMNKVKFRAFGKVSFTNKSSNDKPLENLYKEKRLCFDSKENDDKIDEIEANISNLLLKKQREDYEKKSENLKKGKRIPKEACSYIQSKSKSPR